MKDKELKHLKEHLKGGNIGFNNATDVVIKEMKKLENSKRCVREKE